MFLLPNNAVETEYFIKKSRFITRVARADSRSQAMQLLQKAKQDYPDARHHCWAYLLGESEANSNAAMADDGEPSGTAGKPILNVIQHKSIGNVMVIVIRYFGGIKLGAGGLVRAYSAAAQQGIALVDLKHVVPMIDCTVELDFSQEQSLRHFSEQHQGKIDNIAYSSCVSVELQLPKHALLDLQTEAAKRGWVLQDSKSKKDQD